MAEISEEGIDEILAKLLPVLEAALDGDYSKDIVMAEDDGLNEVYAGIQMLLDVIREQMTVLELSNTELFDYLSKKHGLNK